ncbi:MAG: UDP-N-acetylmuramoyl-tripeptide-D-alanyl-D-alanine ligase [candidate division TM6 bacterium GW2011_GWF2_43_87]|nr:MAG: UDP-N-acetylmuramoyl-tripeptide-D-alanyl-D-alanine ligase [candidate division TM6 bacterium GW2011_GWF2_43_87]
MRLDQKFFSFAVPEVEWAGKHELVVERFVIDSRLVQPGTAFVALKGASTDGHLFVADAIERGATMLIIDADRRDCLNRVPAWSTKVSVAMVPSASKALFKLASAWRAQFSYPVVGITGSIGKTSTKEMLAEMIRLSGKSCVVSERNYNTDLGVALTLLQMRPEHHCALVEMGISLRGEMARLADMARPSMGVITTIAHQHMDGLGALTDIAAEKRDIFKYFKPDNIGIINGDQAVLASVSYSHPVVKFGFKTTNLVQARRISIDGMRITGVLKLYNERHAITLPMPHRGRLLNALAAAATACFLDIPHTYIVAGIQSAAAVQGRFQTVALSSGKGFVINDAYNANPESMREALFAFDRLEVHGAKIAVLGDMLALGANSSFWHRQLGRSLRKTPSIQRIIFVGEQVKAVEKTLPRGLRYQIVSSWQEAHKVLEGTLSGDEAILVKASNGIGLQHLVDRLAL